MIGTILLDLIVCICHLNFFTRFDLSKAIDNVNLIFFHQKLNTFAHSLCNSTTAFHDCRKIFINLFGFQQREEVKLSQIYKDIINSNKSELVYTNKKIINDFPYLLYDDQFGKNYIDSLSIILQQEIEMDSSVILSQVESIWFEDVIGDKIALAYLDIETLSFFDVQVDYLTLNNLKLKQFCAHSTEVRDVYRIDSSSVDNYTDSRNSFHDYKIFHNTFKNHWKWNRSVVMGIWQYFQRRCLFRA